MKSKFTTTLNSELIKEIKKNAIDNNTSVSNIIEYLLYDYLKSKKEQIDEK